MKPKYHVLEVGSKRAGGEVRWHGWQPGRVRLAERQMAVSLHPAVGGRSVAAHRTAFPEDHGLPGSLDVGRNLRAPPERHPSEGESGVR